MENKIIIELRQLTSKRFKLSFYEENCVDALTNELTEQTKYELIQSLFLFHFNEKFGENFNNVPYITTYITQLDESISNISDFKPLIEEKIKGQLKHHEIELNMNFLEMHLKNNNNSTYSEEYKEIKKLILSYSQEAMLNDNLEQNLITNKINKNTIKV